MSLILSLKIRSVVILSLLGLDVCYDAGAQSNPDFSAALKVAKVSAPLSNEEKTVALRLAEQALKSKKLFRETKMYLSEIGFGRDKTAEAKDVFDRLAILTYYRYEGDLTISISINLSRQQVLEVKELRNFAPPISGEELARAKELALSDPRLKDALGPYRGRLIVQPTDVRSESPKDPLYHHRAVLMLFRVGHTYLLPNSRVIVDLTSEKVVVEPQPAKPPM